MNAWSEPVALTADTAVPDLGYPRVVGLGDGSLLACFHTNATSKGERTIEAVRWRP